MSAPFGKPDADLVITQTGDTPVDIPRILLPYQGESIRLSHEHDLLVVEKSRRTGLTYGFAAEAVQVAGMARGGQDVFYIAYNLDMTREFIDYCGEFAKAFNQIATVSDEYLFDDGSKDGIKAFRIDFPSGKSIVALSSKPRSLRGKQGIVIIDEAAFHDQLDELLKAALALLMWGGRVIVISTHNGADNPFNTLIEEIRAGKRKGHVYRIDIEEALRQGLYQRICMRAGRTWSQEAERQWLEDLKKTYGDAADEELYCIPARGSGTYLARAAILGVMSTTYRVERFRCPDEFISWSDARCADFVAEWFDDTIWPYLAQLDTRRRSFFGEDFARSSDLTAISIGQLDVMLRLQVPLIIELRNVPFREQEWILGSVVTRLPLFTAGKMDARGNGHALAEAMQRRFGADRIEAVMTSQNTYLDGFPKLKARIEAKTIVLPQDEGVLDDHRQVKLVRGIPQIIDRTTDKTDGAKGRRHGDTAISNMMLTMAADEDIAPIDLHRLPGGERITAEEYQHTSTGWGTVRRRDAGLDY